MADNPVEKRLIDVHVTFVKVGEINTLKECFEADVLLRTRWREPDLDDRKGVTEVNFDSVWNPKIYIDNVIGEPKRTSSLSVEHNDEGEAFITELRRIKGTYLETMELYEFPFDVQDLSISILSDHPAAEVELREDTEVHRIYKRSFIDEQEWYLYKYVESEKCELLKDMADPTAKRSALNVRCKAARRPSYYIFNCFSVVFLICCLSFVTFTVDAPLVQNRLQLVFTLLLTIVAFRFVVISTLPRIPYLTYLDRYFLASMLMVCAICFWHGLQKLLPDDKHPDKEAIAIGIFISIYAIYNLQFVARLYLVSYMKRREMSNKEHDYVCTVKEHVRKMSQRVPDDKRVVPQDSSQTKNADTTIKSNQDGAEVKPTHATPTNQAPANKDEPSHAVPEDKEAKAKAKKSAKSRPAFLPNLRLFHKKHGEYDVSGKENEARVADDNADTLQDPALSEVVTDK